MAKKLCEKRKVKKKKAGGSKGKTGCDSIMEEDLSGMKYVCKKCKLASEKKKHLCKPTKL